LPDGYNASVQVQLLATTKLAAAIVAAAL